MGFKHSTAPWRIDEVVQCSIHSGDKFIALIHDSGSFSRGEHKANAHLIAAAPELLQVLQLIVSYHDDGNRSLHREDLEMARKAIAKALGQQ
ncbi:hypothetical protein [Providencia manganoxydans]|uniref:hypothetical protein n=1 Tax=Providencia manganoxydans TaxID=2923283 RepID=UPI0032DA4500